VTELALPIYIITGSSKLDPYVSEFPYSAKVAGRKKR
jgi:hypothetical protein